MVRSDHAAVANRCGERGHQQRFPVRTLGSDDGALRENGRFFDQTGKPVTGFMTIGSFNT